MTIGKIGKHIEYRRGVPIIQDKTKTIRDLYPHYTDNRFKQPGGHTVYLAEGYDTTFGAHGDYVDGAVYEYNDRLYSWHDNAQDAWEQAQGQGHTQKSAALHEAWLRILLDNPRLELVHIISGVQIMNGYPWIAYGYISNPE